MKDVQKCGMEILRKAKVRKLPVNTYTVAKRLGIAVSTYEEAKSVIYSAGLAEYCNRKGFCAKIGDRIHIFLSESLLKDDAQRVIGHELGHISMHYRGQAGIIGFSDNPEEAARLEREADEMDVFLQAPVPVLYTMKIKNAAQIEQLTKLNINESNNVMRQLYSYRKEMELIKQSHSETARFQPFSLIYKLKANKRKLGICALCIITAVSLAFCIYSYKHKPAEPAAVSATTAYKTVSADYIKVNNKTKCWWTNSGKVYHIIKDCHSIRNSITRNGTVKRARAFGKSRICEFCRKRNDRALE